MHLRYAIREAIDIELSKRSTVSAPIEKERERERERERKMEGATKNEEPVRVIFLNQFRTNFIVSVYSLYRCKRIASDYHRALCLRIGASG